MLTTFAPDVRLEHHRHLLAAHRAQLRRAHRRDVVSFQDDLPGGRLGEPVEQTHERRLSRAREAHDDEDLARVDRQADIIDGDHVVCAKISLRPRPCFRSSAARSGFVPKIFERFLTVRISVSDAAMDRDGEALSA
jgi:hypothetical protein